MAPPPALRNKGRYVLAALALLGALWACRRPDGAPPPDRVTARVAPDPNAPGCLGDAPDVAKAPPPPQPLSGRLGLWVAEVDPATLRPLRAVAENPDGVFPLASAYKQAVLWAVLRQIDAGKLQPGERFTVTQGNQSLGAYPYDGTNVRDLTDRMMGRSDNTATDILHRRVGLATVQRLADDLGLCRTRLLLTTKAWWAAQAGLSETFRNAPDWGLAPGPERTRLAAAIDAEAQEFRADRVQLRLDAYFEGEPAPEDDLRVHNLSTPYEFATFLAHEYLRPGLGPRARNWLREVAALGFGRPVLRLETRGEVAAFAGKGGNGWRILTYTGSFRTTGGRQIVYAFMQHGPDETYTMPNTRRAFAWINAGVDAVLGEERASLATKPASP